MCLKIAAVIKMKEIDDLKLDGLLDPCANCRNMLTQAGVDVWRFRKSSVDTGPMAWARSLLQARRERLQSQNDGEW